MIVGNNKLIINLMSIITIACDNVKEAQCIIHSIIFNDIMCISSDLIRQSLTWRTILEAVGSETP